MLQAYVIVMMLVTFSTCICFLGLVEENETGFVSAGMSCGKKRACLSNSDVILWEGW